MFEKAARMKLRFAHKGNCTVEDLWDLDVEQLDTIYQALAAKQESEGQKSLLNVRTTANQALALRVDIVKHIVGVKLAEKEAKAESATKRLERKRIKGMIANKKDLELQGKSIEELEAIAASLE